MQKVWMARQARRVAYSVGVAACLALPGTVSIAVAQSGFLTINGTQVFAVQSLNPPQVTFSNACGTQTLTQAQLQGGAIPNQIIPCAQASGALVGQLGRIASLASAVGMSAAQGEIRNIRDRLQAKRMPAASTPLGFAGEPDFVPEGLPEWAMAYTKAPVFKAPRPAPQPAIQWNVWGQGFFDRERRDEVEAGIDFGRTTRTHGGIGGIDMVKPGGFILPADYMVFGILGGYTQARVRNDDGSRATVKGPSVGFYSIWLNGGFSWDSTFKVDFFDLDTTTAPFSGLELRNYVSSNNVNYKFDWTSWWFEPTAGVTVTRLVWDDRDPPPEKWSDLNYVF